MEGRILILKAGELPRAVREKYGPYERAFFDLLGQDRFVTVDARKEPLPKARWNGILITGSAASTYGGDAWIRKSEGFLRWAADCGIRIYGICFGHQLLAQAFGGKVEKCPRGWELGTVPIELRPEAGDDPLFAGMPRRFPAQQTHGDVVVELPPKAVCLAANSHWPIQAFRLGEQVWGTQFHPEFTLNIMREMVQALALALAPDAFPYRPKDRPLAEWLLSGLCETPEARGCLWNFLKKAGL